MLQKKIVSISSNVKGLCATVPVATHVFQQFVSTPCMLYRLSIRGQAVLRKHDHSQHAA
jgi:hypothetical protein